MSELKTDVNESFNEAVDALKERGFRRFSIEENAKLLPGMRWFCEIKGAWAPTLRGKATGYGFDPRGAAINALACQPIPDKAHHEL